MRSEFITTVALALCTLPLSAQSFNLDFGESTTGPSSSYAAAGLPGFWNALRADNNVHYFLNDLAGNATGVVFYQFGGAVLNPPSSDPSVSGNDALLMHDGLITHNPGLDSCFYFNGLQPGTYEVLTYAWRPDDPTLMAKSFIDNTPGLEISGGAWPGSHAHGVTYARHVVTVDGSGFMGPHSGLAAGASAPIGAVCNGMQLRKTDELVAFCFGDGTLSTPCPCSPPNTVPNPPAAAGHGCANSQNLGGALLSATGGTSPDTLAFSVVVSPVYVGFGLMLKGDADAPAGIASSDGVRCVDGQVIRFGAHYAGTNGALQGYWTYPNTVQTNPVSVQTAQPPGQTANYQLYYRNTAANFCTAATTNWSNGLVAVWP